MSPRPRPHAVVVGGTGMLRGATLGLVTRGYRVTCVARNAGKLAQLAKESEGQVQPLCLDYRDVDAFAIGVEEALETHGPVTLVIAWIHGSAPEAPIYLAEIVAGKHGVHFLHVLGSGAADPSAPEESRRDEFEALPDVHYHEVILGFVCEGRTSRWLTDAEISAGVLSAVDHRHLRTVVGTVRPWTARP